MAKILFFICCFLPVLLYALPVENITESDDEKIRAALENPDLYQGDIVLANPDRFAHSSDYVLWPQRTIIYSIDPRLAYISPLIRAAMKHIEQKTCIRFKPRTNEVHYVRIFNGGGCYSAVGRVRMGAQPLSLGYGCHYLGVVVHELMHAIGFFHHHMRTDRDQYLRIHWHNIHPNFHGQFRRLYSYENRIYTPFDYESIMLYGSRTFSRDRFSITMSPTKPGVVLRDVQHKRFLSKDDATSINKLYRCTN
ncbi:uncharacterized protein B4U79_09347 [Dinothrombium tinctorium]|uniref:Metalloendopeptidase n=1 Tax=Dinothrombium tinctorium TaxID=1965070 RepID=A0A443QDA8_9ACAR|nr:uncharacterized protein B4U79_09347 [Dinothrombium tinctorium]